MMLQIYILSIGNLLQDMLGAGPNQFPETTPTIFDSIEIPPISIQSYLARIVQYSECTSHSIIMALVYIDTLVNDDECPVLISQYNAHRFLITAIMIASKFIEDRYFDNNVYSQISGFSLEEINVLERQFLSYIGFNVNTDPQLYINYVQFALSYGVQNGVLDAPLAQFILGAILDKVDVLLSTNNLSE